jgi:hypothetical protein
MRKSVHVSIPVEVYNAIEKGVVINGWYRSVPEFILESVRSRLYELKQHRLERQKLDLRLKEQKQRGGYTITQTRVALCKSWNGYIIAKKNFEMEEIKRYVGQIRKLQKALGLEQTEFDDFSQEELEEIDLEFDDEAIERRYRQAINSNYDSKFDPNS